MERVTRVLDGDIDDFAEIYEELHQGLLELLILRCKNTGVAEDILRDIWKEANPSSKNKNDESLFERYSGQSSLKNWLCKEAINRYLDWCRKTKN